jgi:hypothetical protein
MTRQPASSYQKLWGLLSYKPRWGISAKGWLLIIATIVAITIVFISNIHAFLAVSQPIKAQALVVEGWIGDEILVEVVKEYQQKDYLFIITTGPKINKGLFISEYKNYAELNAASLVSLGINQAQIIAVPTPAAKRNRTLAAALSVKNWLEKSELKIQSINLFSYDVHTRRSWRIYRQVFEPKIKVGAIAASPLGYEPTRWWTYSQGVRSIISETIAYIYAKFLF